eukprot:3613792-Amphidinium_carterae.1
MDPFCVQEVPIVEPFSYGEAVVEQRVGGTSMYDAPMFEVAECSSVASWVGGSPSQFMKRLGGLRAFGDKGFCGESSTPSSTYDLRCWTEFGDTERGVRSSVTCFV